MHLSNELEHWSWTEMAIGRVIEELAKLIGISLIKKFEQIWLEFAISQKYLPK